MFEVAMNDEAKLAIRMIALGMPVPQGILDKAIENAKVKAMTVEPDTAFAYIIDQLIKALEDQDQELMLQVAEMIDAVFGYDSAAETLDSIDVKKAADTLRPMMKEFVEAFILKVDEDERKLRMNVVRAMNDELGVAPLCYHDGMLAFVNKDADTMVIYSYNVKKDKVDYDLMVERCAPKLKILREAGIIGENIDVLCGRLSTKMLPDGQFELRCEEA